MMHRPARMKTDILEPENIWRSRTRIRKIINGDKSSKTIALGLFPISLSGANATSKFNPMARIRLAMQAASHAWPSIVLAVSLRYVVTLRFSSILFTVGLEFWVNAFRAANKTDRRIAHR